MRVNDFVDRAIARARQGGVTLCVEQTRSFAEDLAEQGVLEAEKEPEAIKVNNVWCETGPVIGTVRLRQKGGPSFCFWRSDLQTILDHFYPAPEGEVEQPEPAGDGEVVLRLSKKEAEAVMALVSKTYCVDDSSKAETAAHRVYNKLSERGISWKIGCVHHDGTGSIRIRD